MLTQNRHDRVKFQQKADPNLKQLESIQPEMKKKIIIRTRYKP